MLSSVLYGVFLNWCFHLGNFGMNMYGGYSIYFLDIFDSFAATFVAYLFGIVLVLTLGFAVGMALDKFTKTKDRE
jgi:ABC-type dipeptide/oligopeptide/nickel transport system permease component